MQNFDWFVIPFISGLAIMIFVLSGTFINWVQKLPAEDLTKIRRGLLSLKTLYALKEVFMESLLHRKIFKVKPLLGYMHCSLAFGWFLLILCGNWESRIYFHGQFNPPYIPIFFRFFYPNPQNFAFAGFFSFLMDVLLIIVLSGVILAWIKRMYSRMFGINKTTVLHWGDQLALSSLWMIFPLRFLAESFTSANAGGGNFLTGNAGFFLGNNLPTKILAYPTWWAYSISLGCFFIGLPFSRYMHIPTEVLLIFLRKYGVVENMKTTTFTDVEVHACSRCGICIDPCQLSANVKLKNMQSVYYLQSVRNNSSSFQQFNNCLMCGRCEAVCPVGIDIGSIRLAGRILQTKQKKDSFTYVKEIIVPEADLIFFAGCMTHLQPSIKKSMIELLKAASIKYWFMDDNMSICCGRPLLLSGRKSQAFELMMKNKRMIEASNAKILVTSCPICLKMFKEQYNLHIRILHHSEYLMEILEEKRIKVNYKPLTSVYHDPCELGRGSGIYEAPRRLLKRMVPLQSNQTERKNAFCCGGSLANLNLGIDERAKITIKVLEQLTEIQPDAIITGCPLCKKTFLKYSSVKVLDIAEIVYNCLDRKDEKKKDKQRLYLSIRDLELTEPK